MSNFACTMVGHKWKPDGYDGSVSMYKCARCGERQGAPGGMGHGQPHHPDNRKDAQQ
jgi:hypothetical protein